MKLRRWCLVIGAVAVPAVGLLIWKIESSWREMGLAAEYLQSEFEEASYKRPVAWGKATPGRAWRGYHEAEAALKATGLENFTDSTGADVTRWFESPALASSECWQSVAELSEIFAVLRKAARCRDARPAIDWTMGFSRSQPDALIRLSMARFLALHAWQDRRGGDDYEAVGTLLDLLQYARDQAEYPVAITSLVGTTTMTMVVERFFPTMDSEGEESPADWVIENLSKESLQLFRDGLAILDRPLPRLSWLVRGEALLLAREVQSTEGVMGGILSVGMMKGSWRYAFSQQWMCAQGVLDSLRLADDFPTGASWLDWRDYLDEINASVRSSHNPVTLLVAMNYGSVAVGRRRGIVSLRVLRMLIDRALGEPVVYQDPFGTDMQVDEVSGSLRFWSVGKDGVDQGGDKEKDLVFVR